MVKTLISVLLIGSSAAFPAPSALTAMPPAPAAPVTTGASSAHPALTAITWHTDLAEAQQVARKEHRHILLNFSGSDWCGPCIRMHKEIFEAPVFAQMADSELVMVNADFPRMKKNQLSKKQQDLNNAMADKYNTDGKFPLTLLLNAYGKSIRSWDGLPSTTAGEFARQVHDIIISDK